MIESIVAAHLGGIGIAEIELAMVRRQGGALNRRTLQRRLLKLMDAQRSAPEGQSIALVYKPLALAWAQFAEGRVMAPVGVAEAQPDLPVSPAGASIRDRVHQPLMHRRPVGYWREFLERYQPGVTFYLPAALRSQLHEMGRTPANERPAGTCSRLNTQNLIENGQAAQGKDAIETQMILNHKAAIELLIEETDEVGFGAFTFKNLHAVLSQDLMSDPQASGRLRRRLVEISGTVFHPVAVRQMIEDCFELLLSKVAAIPEPFEQAFFLMVQMPYLQPFEDVNKRVPRIAANLPLIQHKLCPLSFIDVPERAYIEDTLGVYELNVVDMLRDVLVWAYQRLCQRYLAITNTMVEPDPLKIKYREALIQAVQTVVRGLQASSRAGPCGGRMPVPAADQEAFTRMLAEALHQLHEGSVACYRLRRSEYLAWQLVCSGGGDHL